jgi:hypothetical protein
MGDGDAEGQAGNSVTLEGRIANYWPGMALAVQLPVVSFHRCANYH